MTIELQAAIRPMLSQGSIQSWRTFAANTVSQVAFLAKCFESSTAVYLNVTFQADFKDIMGQKVNFVQTGKPGLKTTHIYLCAKQ